MSTKNIARFTQATAADPALQARIQAIQSDIARETAEKIARLAAENGTPFTAEEFLASASPAELSDEQLEAVAGGAWDPSAGNILMSILGLGLLCGIVAGVSAATRGGNSDHKDCQAKGEPNFSLPI